MPQLKKTTAHKYLSVTTQQVPIKSKTSVLRHNTNENNQLITLVTVNYVLIGQLLNTC